MLKTIRYYRKQKRMTQVQLSRELGVADTLVSNWEGQRTTMPAEIVPKLCQVLEITPNELFGFNKE